MYLIKISEFWRRFKKSGSGLIGLIIVISSFIIILFTPIISMYDPSDQYFDNLFEQPNLRHLMGTDQFGRDVFSRIIHATKITLLIGVIAAAISSIIGGLIGAIAGYFGGITDGILMRLADIFLTIPTYFLAILLLMTYGRNVMVMSALIGFTGWPSTARLIRAEFLSLKEKDFVEAARSVGASGFHIAFREILPNTIHLLIVNTTLRISTAILIESGLSFIGLGDPNFVSWGWMLNDAIEYFRRAPWLPFFPGLAISITVIGFNLVGDALNDTLNPRLKEK